MILSFVLALRPDAVRKAVDRFIHRHVISISRLASRAPILSEFIDSAKVTSNVDRLRMNITVETTVLIWQNIMTLGIPHARNQ